MLYQTHYMHDLISSLQKPYEAGGILHFTSEDTVVQTGQVNCPVSKE
jgi:hypothetical protein